MTSFIDPSQVVCGVVSTHNEANARFMGLVLMQGMRRYFKKVQLVDVNSLFKLEQVNKVDRNLLGGVGLLAVDEDCEVLQPSSVLNAYELKLYIDEMRQEGTAVIVVFDSLEAKQNELMLLAGSWIEYCLELKKKNNEKSHGNH